MNNNSEELWRQAFALELGISVGHSLTLELITRNTGKAYQFSNNTGLK